MTKMKFLLKKYLSKEDLQTISAKISEVEQRTSGEIRVVLRHKRHWNERKRSLHELAFAEFHRLGMQNTTHRTGVLILLLMSERKFHIIADEGIHTKVEDGAWDRIAASMSAHFKEKNFAKGICHAVEAVGIELGKYFPRGTEDRHELPNDVVER
jgi:uncharacterized membrane protein